MEWYEAYSAARVYVCLMDRCTGSIYYEKVLKINLFLKFTVSKYFCLSSS